MTATILVQDGLHKLVILGPGQCQVELGQVTLVGSIVVKESQTPLENLGLLLQKALKLSSFFNHTDLQLVH